MPPNRDRAKKQDEKKGKIKNAAAGERRIAKRFSGERRTARL